MLPSEYEARVAKLEKLQSLGTNPYPASVERSHEIAAYLEQFDALAASNEPVSLAGRIMSIRTQGGVTFATLVDESGSIQLFIKKEAVGEEAYDHFVELLDRGDIISAKGTAFTTKRGEKSLAVTSVTLLTKTLMPLPEKWHGLQDVELRYRHRELDLLSNPEIRQRFMVRSKVVSSFRRFLDTRGFLEVETPMLQSIPGGANARPFITHHNALDIDLYLRIAPEIYLKRLLVGGFEKIYEIGRCFRNEGMDYAHNPEFTMMELYWAYANKDAFVSFLEDMVATVICDAFNTLEIPYGDSSINFTVPWPRTTFRDAILEACGIDIDAHTTPESLLAAVRTAGLDIDFRDCHGLGEQYDQLYKKTARGRIMQPTWVFDYPVDLKPLSKAHPTDPTKSSSVQLVVQGAEIINAYYHELNDPIDQRNRFMQQQALRDQGSEEAQMVDDDFVRALEHGMPPASGMGIGIDRLVAFITNSPNLKEVILFPTLRPKE